MWLLFLFIVAAPPFGKFPACLELTTQRDDRVGDHCYCLETWWQKFVPASSSPFSFNQSAWKVIRWLDDYCLLSPSSTGFQPWRHQAGGPVWCWESRDPSCVSGAEFHHLHALDGGGRGQQVCKALLRSNQWLKGFLITDILLFWNVCVPQCPWLILQLRRWIQTFPPQVTNSSQEVPSVYRTHCYVTYRFDFIVCLFFLKLCLHSYSTSSKIFRWAHHLHSGISFHKSSFCCCVCLIISINLSVAAMKSQMRWWICWERSGEAIF